MSEEDPRAAKQDGTPTPSKALAHLKTITRHREEVRKLCFKCGLYKQGLVHDLSKYSPSEFMTGARFFQGDKSPNAVERKTTGVSGAWMHHKGRNKHHFEYWVDVKGGDDPAIVGQPMPTRYVVEMLCDRVAACKVYQGVDYTDASAYEYYDLHRDYNSIMYPDTMAFLEYLLLLFAEKGEDDACAFIRENIVNKRFTYGELGRF